MDSIMEKSTQKFMQNKYKNNLIYYNEINYMDYTSKKVLNNLRSYLYIGDYDTKVFSFVSTFSDKEALIGHIESLSYFDRLMFYADCMVELSMYENDLFKDSKEIKNPLKSYEMIKYVLDNKNDVNCINNFVDRTELKDIMLRVCASFRNHNTYMNIDKLLPIVNDLPKIYNKYIENKESVLDYYGDLVKIKETCNSEDQFETLVNELNSKEKFGILRNFYVDEKNFDKTLATFDNIIGDKEIENYIDVQKDVTNLIKLTNNKYEFKNDDKKEIYLNDHYVDKNIKLIGE